MIEGEREGGEDTGSLQIFQGLLGHTEGFGVGFE